MERSEVKNFNTLLDGGILVYDPVFCDSMRKDPSKKVAIDLDGTLIAGQEGDLVVRPGAMGFLRDLKQNPDVKVIIWT
jgi:hypothetical protein